MTKKEVKKVLEDWETFVRKRRAERRKEGGSMTKKDEERVAKDWKTLKLETLVFVERLEKRIPFLLKKMDEDGDLFESAMGYIQDIIQEEI